MIWLAARTLAFKGSRTISYNCIIFHWTTTGVYSLVVQTFQANGWTVENPIQVTRWRKDLRGKKLIEVMHLLWIHV